jgi:hypothetical protein
MVMVAVESRPADELTPERRAMAVFDAIMHGVLPDEVAARVAGGSFARILDIIAVGLPEERLRKWIALNEIQSAMVIGHFKLEALKTLGSFISGAGFDDLRQKSEVTASDMRIVELRRRACISMARLNPLPTRRDSCADAKMASAPTQSKAARGSSDPRLREWQEAADRIARLQFDSPHPRNNAEVAGGPVIDGATSVGESPAPGGLSGFRQPTGDAIAPPPGGTGERSSPVAHEAEGGVTPGAGGAGPGDAESESELLGLNRAARRRLMRLRRKGSTPSGSMMNGHPP